MENVTAVKSGIKLVPSHWLVTYASVVSTEIF